MKTYSFSDIQEITPKGITLKDGICIDFSTCIVNARERYNNETLSCVAERDYAADPPYFIFYMKPEVKIEFNVHKGLFAKNKNYKDFRHLQLLLQSINLTSYDLG